VSFVQYARSPRSGPGTLLAVAAYEGLAAPFVLSLFASQAALPQRIDLEIFAGNCHVDDSRNRLVRDFLESDCEQMVFLDTDVSWSAADLGKLIDCDRDIVAGVYPRRADDQPFPVKALPGERWSDAAGLVEVAGVPTGFLKIKRRVLETLAKTVPHHRSVDDGVDRRMIPVIFERSLNGNSRVGGDIEFCRKARAQGFKVYVDPLMHLGHQGTKHYYGCLGHYWRRHCAIPEGLEAIRAGIDTPDTYFSMFGAWDNPYALSHGALLTSVILARQANGPILELGAGLSTLCMGAATSQPIISLETVPMWATRAAKQAKAYGLDNVDVRLCDVKQYDAGPWYDEVPDGKFAFVLCDGIENRAILFERMRAQIAEAPILVDDIERGPWRADVEKYCAEEGRRLTVIDGGTKGFGLIQ
jgi:hypothetical protein